MSSFTNPSHGADGAAGEYTVAILRLLGDRDPTSVLSATPGVLARLVAANPREKLAAPEGPGRWSVVQVLQHLADSEIAWAWRLRCTLAQDRPDLAGYDQDAWAARLHYAEADPFHAVTQFEVLRSGHLRLVARLEPADLTRVGVHRERGEESIGHMMKLYAGHDLVHLHQIERILSTAG